MSARYQRCSNCFTVNALDEVICVDCGDALPIRPLKSFHKGWAALIVLLLLLAFTNPDESAFAQWVTEQAMQTVRTPQTGAEALGQSLGVGMGNLILRSVIVRHNFILCSVYEGRSASSRRFLAIAGQFVPLGDVPVETLQIAGTVLFIIILLAGLIVVMSRPSPAKERLP